MNLLPKLSYSESCNIAASGNIAASDNIAAILQLQSCDHCVYKVFEGKRDDNYSKQMRVSLFSGIPCKKDLI